MTPESAHLSRGGSGRDSSAQPVKVCFVSLMAYPYFNHDIGELSGGAELQMYAMATSLAKSADLDVSFITADYGQEDYEEREGVRLYKLRKSGVELGFVKGVSRVIRMLRLLDAVDADVYLQRAWGSVTGEMALYSRVRGRKFVYMTGHDDDLLVGRTPPWLPKGVKSYLQWKIFSSGLKLSDLIVVQHSGQQSVCQRSLKKDCVVRPCAQRAWQGDGNNLKGGYVLWTARCEKWKRPELFLKLAGRVPQLQYVMICPASSDRAYFTKIRDAARETANIRFKEFVAFRDINRYFQGAGLFVNTSESEGFPNTFVQAFQSGTPVVSLSVNPDGILDRHGTGRSAKGSFDGLCKAVEEIMTNGEVWREMSDSALQYFKEHHDIEKVTERDREMILRLVR